MKSHSETVQRAIEAIQSDGFEFNTHVLLRRTPEGFEGDIFGAALFGNGLAYLVGEVSEKEQRHAAAVKLGISDGASQFLLRTEMLPTANEALVCLKYLKEWHLEFPTHQWASEGVVLNAITGFVQQTMRF